MFTNDICYTKTQIASFIRTSDNVRSIIAYLNRCIAELEAEDNSTKYTRPSVISKIENKEGLDNFDEILEASEGIMVRCTKIIVVSNVLTKVRI